MTVLAEAPPPLGRTVPRLYTRPLVEGPPGPCGCGCPLTPETSLGFNAVRFAEEILGVRLLRWQTWWLIHALELRESGTPQTAVFRFRTLLTLVARQNGKTTICKILALWFLYVRGSRLVLGCAQALNIAQEAWQGSVELAEASEDLCGEIAVVRRANGQITLGLSNGARYLITAASRSAGRGLPVDGLLLLDELREQRDWDAWGALSKTTMAQRSPLTVGITNQGDDESVVLNSLRATALAETDDQLGLFEWSAPEGCSIDDVEAWAQANPALGHENGISVSAVRSASLTDPAPTFRTEVLCQRVDALDAAVDLDAWRACGEGGFDLREVRRQVVGVLEVAIDGGHVALVLAAPLGEGRVGVEVAAAWSSPEACRVGEGENAPPLVELLRALRLRALGWFEGSPTGVLSAELAAVHGSLVGTRTFDHSGMQDYAPGVVPLTGRTPVVACMSMAEHVVARKLVHPNDPLLTAHVQGTSKLDQGDGWRFARRGAGQINAAYGAAGALHLARTLPPVRDLPQMAVF